MEARWCLENVWEYERFNKYLLRNEYIVAVTLLSLPIRFWVTSIDPHVLDERITSALRTGRFWLGVLSLDIRLRQVEDPVRELSDGHCPWQWGLSFGYGLEIKEEYILEDSNLYTPILFFFSLVEGKKILFG